MARVIAGRVGKYGFAVSLFDDFTVFQHHHAVRQGADDGEVVADDDEAETVFFLQIGEQLQNLCGDLLQELLPPERRMEGLFDKAPGHGWNVIETRRLVELGVVHVGASTEPIGGPRHPRLWLEPVAHRTVLMDHVLNQSHHALLPGQLVAHSGADSQGDGVVAGVRHVDGYCSGPVVKHGLKG